MADVGIRFRGENRSALAAARGTDGAIAQVRRSAVRNNQAVTSSSLAAAQAHERSMARIRRVTGTATAGFDTLRRSAFAVIRPLSLIGGAVSALAVATGFRFNMMREQAEIAFTTMLDDGAKARAFLDELAKFAARTPFEFPDLVRASQRLLAVGFAAEDVLPTVNAVGNAVAGMGGSPELIDQTIRALGQVQAKGRLMAEEMMQFTEAGTFGWRALARELGVSVPRAMEMVTAGQVSSSEALQAFVRNAAREFPRMMEKQSETVGGMLSTFKDTFGMIMGGVLEPFYEDARRLLKRTLGEIGTEEFEQRADRMGRAFHDRVVPPVRSFIASFRRSWPEIREGLEGATKFAIGFASALGDAALMANTLADAVGGWDRAFALILAGTIALRIGAIRRQLLLTNAAQVIVANQAVRTQGTVLASTAAMAAGVGRVRRGVGTLGLAFGGLPGIIAAAVILGMPYLDDLLEKALDVVDALAGVEDKSGDTPSVSRAQAKRRRQIEEETGPFSKTNVRRTVIRRGQRKIRQNKSFREYVSDIRALRRRGKTWAEINDEYVNAGPDTADNDVSGREEARNFVMAEEAEVKWKNRAAAAAKKKRTTPDYDAEGVPDYGGDTGGGTTGVAGASKAAKPTVELGTAHVAPGADRPGVRTKPHVVTFVRRIAAIFGSPLTITTGTQHNQMTTSGNVSDHWSGDAADIAMSGEALTRLGHAALIAAGADPQWAQRQNGGAYNVGGVQIIFNSMIGGNHWNHLHVGLKALPASLRGKVGGDSQTVQPDDVALAPEEDYVTAAERRPLTRRAVALGRAAGRVAGEAGRRALQRSLREIRGQIRGALTDADLDVVERRLERFKERLDRALELTGEIRTARRSLGRLREIVRRLPADLQGDLMTKVRAIGSVLSKNLITRADIGRVKKMLGELDDAVKAALDKLRERVDEARDKLSDIWGGFAEKALEAFDAQTDELVRKARAPFEALTPAERALDALRARRAALSRESSMADAQSELAFAERIGDPDLIRRARERIAEIELDAEEDRLSKLAEQERDAATAAADTEEKRIRDERRLVRERFQQRLQETIDGLVAEGATYDEAMVKILGLLGEYGVDFESAGFLVGAAFASGFQQALVELVGGAQALLDLLADLGLATDGPGWRGVGNLLPSGRPRPNIPELATGGIVMRPTVARIAERGPEAVIPLDQLPGGSTINVRVDVSGVIGDKYDVARYLEQTLAEWVRSGGKDLSDALQRRQGWR